MAQDNSALRGQLNPVRRFFKRALFVLNNERGEAGDPPPDPNAGDPPPDPNAGDPPPPPPEAFPWKGQLSTDVQNSPLLQKFEDNKDGFAKAVDSHLSLEKMLGHDKVPIPKDANDVEGWNRFSKAMGIPDKAEGYGLPDAEIPETMKELSFNKQQFAEIVHSFKLTPTQAKGLWGAYVDMSKAAVAKYQTDNKNALQEVVNKLRGEWGDAYDTNVELGQMVINKFSADKDSENFITTTLLKDPRGVKFLAKLGNQFAENKFGDFQYKRFSLSPEDAQREIDEIVKDPKHPYNDDKAPVDARNRAIDYVNSRYAIINKAKGQGMPSPFGPS